MPCVVRVAQGFFIYNNLYLSVMEVKVLCGVLLIVLGIMAVAAWQSKR